jgi:ABC-2 type transport system ATP-binding protein
LRADLFRFAVTKGWTLLELRRDAQTLEDVFRDLTKGDERGDRRMGAARDDDDDDAGDRRDSGDRGRGESTKAAAAAGE